MTWNRGVLSWVAALSLMAAVAVGAEPAYVYTDRECIACHGKKDVHGRSGHSRFIDPEKFARSAHHQHGIGCVSCHKEVTADPKSKRRPHLKGVKPDCAECHAKISREYSRSVHAQVSEKVCYSCHNPHYSVSFRRMTGEERKGICLKCHDVASTHRWLPQKQLHFNYLECTSCHAVNAQIGMVFFIVNKVDGYGRQVLDYSRLSRSAPEGTQEIIGMLDKDGNGRLSDAEIRAFMERLRKNGFPDAVLDVRILVLNPTHNFSSRGEQAKDCTLCHSEDAKFYSKLVLELPEKDGGFRTIPVEKGILVRRGQRPYMGDFYILGESKISKDDLSELAAAARRIGFKWIDLLGTAVVLFSIAAVTLHGMLMFGSRKLRRPPYGRQGPSPHPLPIGAWHWVHGFCAILLIFTGIQLRLPDVAPIFATFLNAVNLHNLCGAVLICDYSFWIVYSLWTGELRRRYLVSPSECSSGIAEMLHYYGYLIFVGEKCPLRTTDSSPFDPVERVFFVLTMFGLLPLQMATGMLLYDVQRTLPAIQALGGLRVVDATHVLCAYLFVSFTIVHVYFHTLKKYRLAGREG